MVQSMCPHMHPYICIDTRNQKVLLLLLLSSQRILYCCTFYFLVFHDALKGHDLHLEKKHSSRCPNICFGVYSRLFCVFESTHGETESDSLVVSLGLAQFGHACPVPSQFAPGPCASVRPLATSQVTEVGFQGWWRAPATQGCP